MFEQFEDALKAKIKEHFKKHLKSVEIISGALSEETLKKQSLNMPGVFMRFIGVNKGSGYDEYVLRWALFPMVGDATAEEVKKRGNANRLGIYKIIEQLILLLNDQKLTDAEGDDFAALEIKNSTELYSQKLDSKGIVAWSIELEATVVMSVKADESLLDDFEAFEATVINDDKEILKSAVSLEK